MKKNIVLFSLILTTLFSCKDDEEVTTNLNKYAISALAFDNSGLLWVGSDIGLFISVPTGFQLVNLKNDAPVTALEFDEANNILWVGTMNGLSKLSLSGNGFRSDTIPSGKLSNQNISSAYVDSNSVTWFGTAFGITRNNSDKWQKDKFKKNVSGTISAAAFENIGVNSIAAWDGDYFFATNGNSVYKASIWNETINAFSGASQLLNPYNGFALTDTMYVVFIDSKGQQWMGGRSGIQVHTGHDPKSDNISFYDELVNPVIHCVAEAPDGKIWVGTENGISIYDGSTWTASEAVLPNNFVTAIAFDKDGKAWVGTKKGVVSLN
jgi:hypothetical protein